MQKIKKNIFYIATITSAILIVSCSGQDVVSIKLTKQFKKYDQAKELIIERNFHSSDPISRDEWDDVLKVEENDVLTEAEKDILRENHRLLIEQASQKAARSSEIDIEAIRGDQSKLDAFCHEVPKGGMLHVHPYGLLSRNVVRELLEKYDPEIIPENFIATISNFGQVLYEAEKVKLRNLPSHVPFSSFNNEEQESFIDFFFLPRNPESHDFTRFDAIFAFVIWLIEDENQDEKMEIVYRDFLKSEAAEGLTYVEFTNGFSPSIESIEKLEKWSSDFLKDTGVTVRWNMGQLRFLPAAQNAEMIKAWNKLLLERPSEVIVGTDLYAIERGNPALEKAQDAYGYLSGFNNENENHPIKMTMHAGELGNIHNVRDAMLMGVSRVGHGVLLGEDLITLEYARHNKLAIEMNIISNHQLSVHNMKEKSHPFLDFLRLGLKVSLSTDNNAIFDTSIKKECVAAFSTTDLTYAEWKTLSYNSIETSFADEKVKDDLSKGLRQRFTLFEQQYNDR